MPIAQAAAYNRCRRRELVSAGRCGWCGAGRETYRWLCNRCATIHREKQRAKSAERALLGITKSYTAFIAGDPSRRHPVSESLSDQVKSAIDLSTWDERRGFGSIKGPICPHCQTLQRPALCAQKCGRVGVAKCETCAKDFCWRQSQGPMGWQWDTWYDVPKESK